MRVMTGQIEKDEEAESRKENREIDVHLIRTFV